VTVLLNTDSDNVREEIYGRITDYSNDTKLRYKPKSKDELTRLFRIIQSLNPAHITDWIDMSDYFTVIDAKKNEIPVHEYKKGAKFIHMKEHDILIYALGDHMYTIINWSTDKGIEYPEGFIENDCKMDMADAIHDMDGFYNTYQNMNMRDDFSEYPAFNYVNNIKIPGYIAYIPALGELNAVIDNIMFINYILRRIGQLQKLSIWTNMIGTMSSTEATQDTYWGFIKKGTRFGAIPYATVYKNAENKNMLVLPLFKKK